MFMFFTSNMYFHYFAFKRILVGVQGKILAESNTSGVLRGEVLYTVIHSTIYSCNRRDRGIPPRALAWKRRAFLALSSFQGKLVCIHNGRFYIPPPLIFCLIFAVRRSWVPCIHRITDFVTYEWGTVAIMLTSVLVEAQLQRAHWSDWGKWKTVK